MILFQGADTILLHQQRRNLEEELEDHDAAIAELLQDINSEKEAVKARRKSRENAKSQKPEFDPVAQAVRRQTKSPHELQLADNSAENPDDNSNKEDNDSNNGTGSSMSSASSTDQPNANASSGKRFGSNHSNASAGSVQKNQNANDKDDEQNQPARDSCSSIRSRKNSRTLKDPKDPNFSKKVQKRVSIMPHSIVSNSDASKP